MTEWGTARHGTTSGFRRHQTLEERPCDPCFYAKQAYDGKRRALPRRIIKDRLASLAQSLALKELKNNHYNEYRDYYEKHKVQLTKEAENE
ncbi:MAG: hypothetical protein ACREOB_05665 [Thermodesulfobacteriota bacterium]